MIKVLHLRDTDKVCGPGKTILETARHIDSSRFKLSVGLFLLSSEHKNLYRQTLENHGIEVIPLVARSQFSPAIINTIIREIRTRNIDIIHSHDYKSDLIAAWIGHKIKIPVVTTAHGWITNSLKSKLYTWMGKNSFRFFDRVIAVSPKIHDEIARFGVSDNQLTLIYNAIVADNYQPQLINRGYLRHRFKIAENCRIIGNIGRISPEKGQRDFLLAAAELLKQRPNLAFVLTGDGPDRSNIEQLAQSLGIQNHVHFTGHEQDVRPVFRDLDLFALTSHTEGFPNVVLESLCMGIPVLATNVGGTADIISNHETGILVESGKPDDITQGLMYLLDNPDKAQVMTTAGKQKIMREFEFKARVLKIETLYTNLLQNYTS